VTQENTEATTTPGAPPAAASDQPATIVPAEVTALQAQLAARDAEFGTLKALTASQAEELTTLRTAGAVADEKITGLTGDLSEAIAKYKERLQAANPSLPDSMVTGETIGALDASLVIGLELVDKVKANIDEQAKEVTVPAGSPERTGLDPSTLSTKEKINIGLENARKGQ